MIQFPTELDNLSNPQEADKQNSPLHTDQHANANDAIEALEAKVGIDDSEDIDSIDYRLSTLETNNTGTNTGDQDLSGKVDANTAITGATKTKITYDAKGLVTSGADATTADITDSSNKRYVTDANLTAIWN